MTWRERIHAARERGEFSAEDWGAWLKIFTCPAAECVRAYGVADQGGRYGDWWNAELHIMGNDLGALMHARDFDGAERLLDALDDRALALKRELA